MALIRSYDDLVNRVGGLYSRAQPVQGEQGAATHNLLSNNTVWQRCGDTQLMPNSLPTGVSSFIPTRVTVSASTTDDAILICWMTSLGSLNIATPTFTDGNAMPTVTELGVSNVTYSPVLCEVTTVLNGTPGSLQIKYVDQSGNASELAPATAMTASAAVGSSSWVPLNAGDWGVQDLVTGTTRTGGTTPTGTVKFWGVIPIALVPANLTNSSQTPVVEDLIIGAMNMIRLPAAAQVGCFFLGSTAAKVVWGDMYLIGDS